MIVGLGWIIKTIRDINKSRVPLEASLLGASNGRRS